MSFRDISKIIKAHDKKIRLQSNQKENNPDSQIKKPSISSLAFKQFREGKQLTDVAIDLEIPANKAEKIWSQFLKLERMYECYEFYQVCENDLPTLLPINNFMKRNNVSGSNIVNILRTASDVNNLNKTYFNLKTEIKNLEQKRMYLLSYSPTPYSLQTLPSNKMNYNYYRY